VQAPREQTHREVAKAGHDDLNVMRVPRLRQRSLDGAVRFGGAARSFTSIALRRDAARVRA
jgi:hypothetical protein